MDSQSDQYAEDGKKSFNIVGRIVLVALEHGRSKGQVGNEREGHKIDEGTSKETFGEVVLECIVVGGEVEQFLVQQNYQEHDCKNQHCVAGWAVPLFCMSVAVITPKAAPTEFIPAFSTHHVLAPTILLNKDATLGTRLFK